jgi:hypothetical protein
MNIISLICSIIAALCFGINMLYIITSINNIKVDIEKIKEKLGIEE